MKLLLDRGCDIDAVCGDPERYRGEHGDWRYDELRDNQGKTALHLCCERGDVGTAELLLQRGAALDTPDNKRATPLIVACRAGNSAVAALLIHQGAHIDSADLSGKTALVYASGVGDGAIAGLLVSKRTPLDPDVASGRFVGALHEAAYQG